MRTSRLVWVGIVVLSLWAPTVYGQPRQGMGGMGAGRMMEDGPGMLLPLVLKGIKLTDAQEKRVQEIMAAHRAAFRTLFGELRAAHERASLKPWRVREPGLQRKQYSCSPNLAIIAPDVGVH
jgi:Spy/CpxP family protein refolding chaperone